MKMLLLTAMFVMLFYRIKNTYQSISKKKWESELKDNIEILKKFKEEKQSYHVYYFIQYCHRYVCNIKIHNNPFFN